MVTYIPNNAYLVLGSTSTILQASEIAGVQWSSPYTARLKLARQLDVRGRKLCETLKPKAKRMTRSPEVPGNQPSAYWPGGRFVNWVGADIYSKFASPGVLAALQGFYRRWHHWPFVIGEYSPWDNDYGGSFTRHLFKWALHHGRVRALIYYRSVFANNEFDINHWPAARHVIRHFLNKHRFDPYAPGVR